MNTAKDLYDNQQRDRIIDRQRCKPSAKVKQAGAKPGQTFDRAASKRGNGYYQHGKEAHPWGSGRMLHWEKR